MDILELKREFQTYKEKISGIKQTVKLEEREKTVEELEQRTDSGTIKKKASLL